MTNWLISYPRSGNTWYRYCVEFLSKRPTKGYDHKLKNGKRTIDEPLCYFHANGADPKKPHILVKRHEFPNIAENDKAIVMLRNPKEVIIRHFKSMQENDIFKVLDAQVEWYFNIINAYEKSNREKTIVYYEDLIANPAGVMKKSMEFLEIPDDHYNDFVNNIQKHKKAGLKVYNKQFPSMTKGAKAIFHSVSADKNAVRMIDEKLQEKSEELYDKYLKRYK